MASPTLRGEHPAKHRPAASTFGKFLVVGITYLLNHAVLFLVYELAATGRTTSTPLGRVDTVLLLASLVAIEVSIIVRFELNDRWTFAGRGQKKLGRRFLESNLSSFGSPVISLAAINVLTPQFGLHYLVANSIGILLGLAWNWLWSSRVVWRQSATRSAGPTTFPSSLAGGGASSSTRSSLER